MTGAFDLDEMSYDQFAWEEEEAELMVLDPITRFPDRDPDTETQRLRPARIDSRKRGVLHPTQRSRGRPVRGSVMAKFMQWTGKYPRMQALTGLRHLYRCTGPITRPQSRLLTEMVKPFEEHAEAIHANLALPCMQSLVARILTEGHLHQPEEGFEWALGNTGRTLE
jgi:hypothetical protein